MSHTYHHSTNHIRQSLQRWKDDQDDHRAFVEQEDHRIMRELRSSYPDLFA